MNWTYTLGTEDGKQHLIATNDILTMPFPEQVEAYETEFGSRLMWIAVGPRSRDSAEGQRIWDRPADMDDRIAAGHAWRARQAQLERVRAAIPGLQERCAKWRTAPDKASWVDPTPINVAFKAGEEVGEFFRAVLGVEEHREGRGDPFQEAAQTVLVLLAWFGIHHPDRDLLTEVLDEMERAGA